MNAAVRQALRELWEQPHPAHVCKADCEGYCLGSRNVIRRIWQAQGIYGAPCRHCWESEHLTGYRGEAGDREAHGYEPVEGW